jgi:tetratricopeptide (TPR) repeat protein
VLTVLASLLVLATDPAVPTENAADLARRAMVEYDAGEFEKALQDATRAYEIDPRPELLFNLGQCHRALGHWKQAEFFYRGFLRQRPDAEARPKVEKLIAKMVDKQEEEAAAAPKTEPVLVPVPAPTSTEPAAPTTEPVPAVVANPPAPMPGFTLSFGGGVTAGVTDDLGPVMASLRVEAGLHPYRGGYLSLGLQTGADSQVRETSTLLLVGYRFGLALGKLEMFAAPALGGGLVIQSSIGGSAQSGASLVGALAANVGVAYDFDGRIALGIEGDFPIEILKLGQGGTLVAFLPAGWLMLRFVIG